MSSNRRYRPINKIWADNEKLYFGDDKDGWLVFDGTQTIIGTDNGDLRFSPASALTYCYTPGTNSRFQIYDGTGADVAQFTHDGTDFNTSFSGTTDWNWSFGSSEYRFNTNDAYFNTHVNVEGGHGLYIIDSTGMDWANSWHDGTDFYTSYTNTTWHRFTNIANSGGSGGWIFDDGGTMYIRDTTGSDYMTMGHDGTDFNVGFSGTTDINWNTGPDAWKWASSQSTSLNFWVSMDSEAVNSTDGWITVAEKASATGRGQAIVAVAFTGGTASPSPILLSLSTSYDAEPANIHLLSGSTVGGSITDVRSTYDSTTGDKTIDIQVSNGTDATLTCHVINFGIGADGWQAGIVPGVSTPSDVGNMEVDLNTTGVLWGVFPTGADDGEQTYIKAMDVNNEGLRWGSAASTANQETDAISFYHDQTNGVYVHESGTTSHHIFGLSQLRRSANAPLVVSRLTDDGSLVSLRQQDTEEGTISVSGTTVSYNGAHLSFKSQLPSTHVGGRTANANPDIVRGTVMEYVNEKAEWFMEVWEDPRQDGGMNRLGTKVHPIKQTRKLHRPEQANQGRKNEDNVRNWRVEQRLNEQRMRSKVSDTAGATTVAGVFERWDTDEGPQDEDFFVATTGDYLIRVTGPCEMGDLLESNGDGTARVQADDIIRSSTIAKAVQSFPGIAAGVENPELVPCQLLNG